MTEQRLQDVLFAELALMAGKPFDGLAVGTFTTMMGDEITITTEDLKKIVSNTKKVINSTKTESGEIVGLPIDEDGHDHKGGAGWIVGVDMSADANVILFTPKWTDIGMDLIVRSIRRYFSATFDLVNLVIMGGSLTNWPASKDKIGRMALRPIELSECLKEITMPKTDELEVTTPVVEDPKGDPMPEPKVTELEQPSETIMELLRTPEAIAELGRRAQALAEEKISAEKRKTQVIEFASTLVGGTRDHPFGLPVRADELVSLLLSLPVQQAQAVQKMLTKALGAAIDFAEKGIGGENFLMKPKLTGLNLSYAQKWVASGKKIEDFFTVNPEVGNAEDFNLSEFKKE